MATVIGSASIRLSAEDAGLKQQINRDLNDAIKSSRITADPLVAVQQQLRASELDLVKAQQQSAVAEENLARADQTLTKLRAQRAPDTKALAAAELALYRAQLEVASAGDKVSEAERVTAAVEAVLTRATKDVTKAKADASRAGGVFTKALGVLRGALNATLHPLSSTRSGVVGLGSAVKDLGTKLVSAPIKAAGRLFDDFGTKARKADKILTSGIFSGFKKIITESVMSPLNLAGAGFSGLGKLGSAAMSVLGSKVALFGAGGAAALGPLFGMLLALPGIALAGGAAIGVLKLGTAGLQAATKQLTPAVNALKASVSGVFQKQLTPVFATLIPVLQALTGPLDQVAGAVSGVIKQLVGVINTRAGIDQLRTALGGAADFITAMGPGLATLLRTFLTLASTVAPQMHALGASIGGIFGSIAAAINQLKASGGLDQIFADLPKLFSGLGAVIQPLLVILGNFGAQLTGSLGGVLKAVGAALTAAEPGLNAFGAAVGAALDAIAPVLKSLGPLLGQLARLLGSVLVSAVAALAPPLTTLINGLSKTLAPVLPVLTSAFGSLAQALQPIAQVLVKALLMVFQALAPMLPQIVSFIAQLAGMFGQLLSAALPILPPLLQLVQAVFPLLIQILQAAMPVLQAVVGGVKSIVPPLASLIKFITANVVPIIKALLPVVTQVFQGVAKIITDVMNIVKGIVHLVLGLLTGNWKEAMSGIREIVSGGWNLIKDVFTTALHLITGAVSAGVKGVISFFRNLPSSILHVLGNLGSLLFKAGKAILQGLINGIKSMAGFVGDALSGSVKGATHLVEGLFGIHSPSTLFHGYGVFLMQGLANGITAAARQAVMAARAASSSVAGAFTPNLNATVSTNAAQAAVTRAITPRPVSASPTATTEGGDVFLDIDLGEGITQRIRIANKELWRKVKAGSPR